MTSLDERPAVSVNLSHDLATLTQQWVAVCPYADLMPERGVCALIGGRIGGRQVAVFRTWEGGLFAVDNQDPFTGAFVLSRGIVGTVGDRWVVASPMLKQRFDLATGQSLDDPNVSIDTFGVRVVDGLVEVSP